jgi:hypothetical protein
MVSVLTSSAVDCGFEPRSGKTKDYKINICCFSAKHTALRRKSKDWSARHQDNVSECGDVVSEEINIPVYVFVGCLLHLGSVPFPPVLRVRIVLFFKKCSRLLTAFLLLPIPVNLATSNGLTGIFISFLFIQQNRIGGVMVSVLTSSVVDRGFEPRSGQTKDYEINIFVASPLSSNL